MTRIGRLMGVGMFLVVAGGPNLALAQTSTPGTAQGPKNLQRSPQEQQLVQTLHKVEMMLHRADHDYDRQRHEALEHVRAALIDLHAPAPPATGKFGGMTQARSDEILRETLPMLKNARMQLATSGAPGHHHAAARKIDEAINKINISLKIR